VFSHGIFRLRVHELGGCAAPADQQRLAELPGAVRHAAAAAAAARRTRAHQRPGTAAAAAIVSLRPTIVPIP
jgi:hypothetical protein